MVYLWQGSLGHADSIASSVYIMGTLYTKLTPPVSPVSVVLNHLQEVVLLTRGTCALQQEAPLSEFKNMSTN